MILRLPFWNGHQTHKAFDDAYHWELPEELTGDEEAHLRHRLGGETSTSDFKKTGKGHGYETAIKMTTVQENTNGLGMENQVHAGGQDGPYGHPLFTRKTVVYNDEN